MKKGISLPVFLLLCFACSPPIEDFFNPPKQTWARSYGGTFTESADSIQQTSDGGYIVAGGTYPFGAGDNSDAWVLKLPPDGAINFNPSSGAAMTTTNAIVTGTSATITTTAATVTNTSATVINTSATVTDTNATVQQQYP